MKELLIDQGTSDIFLENQLKPDLLEQAYADADIPLTVRPQEGYDHSYFFIEDHPRWHGKRLSTS